ncbi:MAG TPA: Hsp20/alpha crystallin family protein [Polyangiaceae bacterium]|nr:Hsp20/alpha crystallin family protein [Polyangiaceae bacterium]
MSISRWDPFRELEDMNRRFNRMFGLSARGAQENLTIPDWHPSVDIAETPETYVIAAELPDVKREDIKVNVENGVLTLKGERKLDREDKGKKFHRVERSYGTFVRAFSLPETVDENTIKAEAKDGVLTVTLQKSAKQKPKTIEVKVA